MDNQRTVNSAVNEGGKRQAVNNQHGCGLDISQLNYIPYKIIYVS